MKWGDINRGYNWNPLLVLGVVACFGISFLIPFSTLAFVLVGSGAIMLLYLFLKIRR